MNTAQTLLIPFEDAILISFLKSLSKGCDIMYYVQVDYYTHRKDNFYDDEI